MKKGKRRGNVSIGNGTTRMGRSSKRSVRKSNKPMERGEEGLGKSAFDTTTPKERRRPRNTGQNGTQTNPGGSWLKIGTKEQSGRSFKLYFK